MKVAFVNNSDNNAYRLCKWFRACGYESDLFITPREREIGRSAPEMVDRELAEQGYPDWIRTWESKPGAAWYLRSGDMGRQIDRDYDIAITSGSQGLLAAHSLSLPLAHQTLGSDITDRPFDLFGLGSAPSIRGARW